MVKPRRNVGFRTQELTFSSKAKVHHQEEEFSKGQKKVAPLFLSTDRSEALYNIFFKKLIN